MKLCRVKSRLLRYWAYFRRSHGTYFVYFISFANFIVIQYRLLIEYVPFLKYMFSSLTAFALTFIIVYVPLAIVIGWLDYKKMSVPTDSALIAKSSPWNRDIAKALYLMAEGKTEEAKRILERWI